MIETLTSFPLHSDDKTAAVENTLVSSNITYDSSNSTKEDAPSVVTTTDDEDQQSISSSISSFTLTTRAPKNERSLEFKNWDNLWYLLSDEGLQYSKTCFVAYCYILAPISHHLTQQQQQQQSKEDLSFIAIPCDVVKLLWNVVISEMIKRKQPALDLDTDTDVKTYEEQQKSNLSIAVDHVLEVLIFKLNLIQTESIALVDYEVALECIKFSNKKSLEYGYSLFEENPIDLNKTKENFVNTLLDKVGLIKKEDIEKWEIPRLPKPMNAYYYYTMLSFCHLLKNANEYLVSSNVTKSRIETLGMEHGTFCILQDINKFYSQHQNQKQKIQEACEVIASYLFSQLVQHDDKLPIKILVAHAFVLIAEWNKCYNTVKATKYYHQAYAIYEDLLIYSTLLLGDLDKKQLIELELSHVLHCLGNCFTFQHSQVLIFSKTSFSKDLNFPTPLNYMNYIKFHKNKELKLNDKAMIYYDRAFQLRRAISSSSSSLSTSNNSINCKPLIAETLHCIGVLYFEANNYTYSLSCFMETLKIHRSLQNKLAIAETLEWIGHLHSLLKKYHSSITAFHEALTIRSASLQNNLEIALLYQSIGIVYECLGEHQASLLRFSEALRIMRSYYNKVDKEYDEIKNADDVAKGIFEVLCLLGKTYSKLENINDALNYYIEAMGFQLNILKQKYPSIFSSKTLDDAKTLPLPIYIHFSTNNEGTQGNKDVLLTTFSTQAEGEEQMFLAEGIQSNHDLSFRPYLNVNARVIELSIMKYGPNHLKVSEYVLEMANLYLNTRQYQKAKKCFQEVIRILHLQMIDHYDVTIQMRQNFIRSTYKLGICSMHLYELRSCIKIYEGLISELKDEKRRIDFIMKKTTYDDNMNFISNLDSFLSEVQSTLNMNYYNTLHNIHNADDFDDNVISVEAPLMETLVFLSDIFFLLGFVHSLNASNDKAFVALLYCLKLRQYIYYYTFKNTESSKEDLVKSLTQYAYAYHCFSVSYVLVTGNYDRGCDLLENTIIPMYNECFNSETEEQQTHFNYGHAYYYLGQMYQGLALFGKASTRSSLDPASTKNTGIRDETTVEQQQESPKQPQFDQFNLDKSLIYYNQALNVYKKNYLKDHAIFGHVYLSIGSIYDSRGMYTKAIRCFHHTLKIYNRFNQNGEHLGVAIVLNSLGIVCAAINEERSALNYFLRSYALRKRLLGETHASTADSLHNLGGIYAKLRMYSDSIQSYRACLIIRKETYGNDHLLVAKTSNNMGIVYTHLRKFRSALERFKEALRIRRLHLPPDSEDLASSYYLIGNVHARAHEYEMAIECYQESLRIRRTLFGDDSLIIANMLQNMGALYEEINNLQEARDCFDEALEVKRLRLGEDDIAVAVALNRVGCVTVSTGDYEEALACFRKSLTVHQTYFGHDHVEVARTLVYFGDALTRIGSYDSAKKCFTEALRIREQYYENHDVIASTLFYMGKLHDAKSEYEDAMLYYGNAFRIYNSLGKHRTDKDRILVADALRQVVAASNGRVGVWDTFVVTGDYMMTLERMMLDLVELLRVYIVAPSSEILKGTLLNTLRQILEKAKSQAIILKEDSRKYGNAIYEGDILIEA